MRRLLIGGAAALAVGLGSGWWYMGLRADAQPAYLTAKIERGDLERSVTALGSLEPLQYVDVGTQVSGQLRKILVKPGDVVQAGDLLAEIDPTVYKTRVEADRATLLGLQAQLAEKRALMKLAEQQHARQSGLLKANATSREVFDAAAAEVDAARARIGQLEAEIVKARSTLEADEANLGYARIVAPMAGTVMSLTARQGQTLNANQQAPIILQIADLETMTVRTQVSEADIGKLRPGMEAYFSTLGEPGRRWTGKLRQILPTPEVINDVVLYNALFEVANSDRRLMPKMSAQVFFVLDRVQDAVLAPVAALSPAAKGKGEKGRGEVKVVTAAGIEPRTVRIGIQDRVNAQILDGLAPGDAVVLNQAAERSRSGASGAAKPPGMPPRIGS